MTTIWKLKNIAPITKMSIESTVATASLAAITTVLIATKVIAGPASLALIASPAGIAVLFIVAVYFAAAAYASYQQMNAIENVKGKDGANGKDADFSVLLGDMVKSGEVVEETTKDENQQDVKQLHLKLSKDDYEALRQGKSENDGGTLYVLSESKSVEVKFKHVAAANDNDNYKVELTSVGSKDQLADMKEELSMNDSNPLKVAVSDKGLEALKNEVSAKLEEVAVNAALSKIAQK